jgi:hypothetical protein
MRFATPSSSSTALVIWTGRSWWASCHRRLAADAEDHRHAVVLDEQLEEVPHGGVGVDHGLAQALLLLLGREVRREEEGLQLAAVVQRVGELADLVAHVVQLVVLGGDLVQRPRVDLGDLLH